MMQSKDLKGVIAAIVTPFKPKNRQPSDSYGNAAMALLFCLFQDESDDRARILIIPYFNRNSSRPEALSQSSSPICMKSAIRTWYYVPKILNFALSSFVSSSLTI